jgi:hypothetical protein
LSGASARNRLSFSRKSSALSQPPTPQKAEADHDCGNVNADDPQDNLFQFHKLTPSSALALVVIAASLRLGQEPVNKQRVKCDHHQSTNHHKIIHSFVSFLLRASGRGRVAACHDLRLAKQKLFPFLEATFSAQETHMI